MKFKVGFSIEAETLFKLMSQFLPVDDLHVEELTPPISVSRTPAWDALVGNSPLPLNKPKPKVKGKFKRRASKPMDLNTGINRIIMEAMADGKPHRAIEFKPLLTKAGFSANSVGSRLQNLEVHGIVIQRGDGTWTLSKPSPGTEPGGSQT
jgi:hypothetical protein